MTAVSETPVLFDFEQAFVDGLRCIPMAVRFKLDLSGVKLSLRQWSRFTLADRTEMLTAPCETPEQVERYRLALIDRIARRAGEPARLIPIPHDPPWAAIDRPPDALGAHAMTLGLEPPTPNQWRALTDLQRFALVKLSREGHDNVNFVPALREFGVLPPIEAQPATGDPGMIATRFAVAPLGAMILSGGAASRMGADKAELDWLGARAVDRVAAVAREVGATCLVTVGPRDHGLAHVVEDPPLSGPVGGVLAGAAFLRNAGCARALVLAVDAPTLTASDVEPLLRSAAAGAAYEGLHFPLVFDLAGLPQDAEPGWPMARLAERIGVSRLSCAADAHPRLRGANTPKEREVLLRALAAGQAPGPEDQPSSS
jgi:molybdopterin-guanine dinucleotide biosynthesis protein A